MRVTLLDFFKSSRMNSLLYKTAFIAGLMTLTVVLCDAWLSHKQQRELIVSGLADRAREVTQFLALQTGGAIKFDNRAGVSETVTDVIEGAHPEAIGAVVMNVAGEIVFATGGTMSKCPRFWRWRRRPWKPTAPLSPTVG